MMDDFQTHKKLTEEEKKKLVEDALAAIPPQKPAPLMVEIRNGHMADRPKRPA